MCIKHILDNKLTNVYSDSEYTLITSHPRQQLIKYNAWAWVYIHLDQNKHWWVYYLETTSVYFIHKRSVILSLTTELISNYLKTKNNKLCKMIQLTHNLLLWKAHIYTLLALLVALRFFALIYDFIFWIQSQVCEISRYCDNINTLKVWFHRKFCSRIASFEEDFAVELLILRYNHKIRDEFRSWNVNFAVNIL